MITAMTITALLGLILLTAAVLALVVYARRDVFATPRTPSRDELGVPCRPRLLG